MASRVAPKVIGAAVGALVAELTDEMLQNAGMSDDNVRLVRVVITATVSTLAGILVTSLLGGA